MPKNVFEKLVEALGSEAQVEKKIQEIIDQHGISREAATMLLAQELGVLQEGEGRVVEKAFSFKDFEGATEVKSNNLVVKVAYVSKPKASRAKDGKKYVYAIVFDHEGNKGTLFAWNGDMHKLQELKPGDVVKVINGLPMLNSELPGLRVTKYTRIIKDPVEDDRYEKAKALEVKTSNGLRYRRVQVKQIEEIFERIKAKNPEANAFRASIRGTIIRIYRATPFKAVGKDGSERPGLILEFNINETRAIDPDTIRGVKVYTPEELAEMGLDFEKLYNEYQDLKSDKKPREAQSILAENFKSLLGSEWDFRGHVIREEYEAQGKKVVNYYFKVREMAPINYEAALKSTIAWLEKEVPEPVEVALPVGSTVIPVKVLNVDKVDYIAEVEFEGAKIRAELEDTNLPEKGKTYLMMGKVISTEGGLIMASARTVGEIPEEGRSILGRLEAVARKVPDFVKELEGGDAE